MIGNDAQAKSLESRVKAQICPVEEWFRCSSPIFRASSGHIGNSLWYHLDSSLVSSLNFMQLVRNIPSATGGWGDG